MLLAIRLTEDLKVTPRFIYFTVEQDSTEAEPGLIYYQQRHNTTKKERKNEY